MRTVLFCLFLVSAPAAAAQAQDEPVLLAEQFVAGYQYRVSCRVAIEGELSLPGEKGPPPQNLKVAGKSVIDYHERVLSQTNGRVDRTVRKVERMDFHRTVADQEQESRLRPAASLLVILRHNHMEVPFSPNGPLLWSEIDLVRTDVFTPALEGLYPSTPIRPGARWKASDEAVRELTDLEQVKKGELVCRFDGVEKTNNRRLARVSFAGKIEGVGEDGPAKHELDGYFFFDLQSGHLAYLTITGKHEPLNLQGLPQGAIRGTFVLTRDPEAHPDLADAVLRGKDLQPNDANTLLLHESPEVRFLYPRHFRVAGSNGRQIGLDEKQGNGLMITVDSLAKTPTSAQFLLEVRNWLNKEKAQAVRIDAVRAIPTGSGTIEHFAVDCELLKQRAILDYFVVRQPQGGATLTGRLLPQHAARLHRDLEQIAKSMQITVK